MINGAFRVHNDGRSKPPFTMGYPGINQKRCQEATGVYHTN